MRKGKFKDVDRSNMKVDVLIKEVPYENYLQIREDLINKGYTVQGFQDGFWQDLSKKEIDHED